MTYKVLSDTGVNFGLYEVASSAEALNQLALRLARETGWPLKECQDLVTLGRYTAVPVDGGSNFTTSKA